LLGSLDKFSTVKTIFPDLCRLTFGALRARRAVDWPHGKDGEPKS